MNRDYIESKLLRLSKEAFDEACTLRPNQRIEVYLDGEVPKRSDVLEGNEAIVYTPQKVLCYQIFGHDYLEPEITEWISSAREEEEPQELEKSIIETGKSIAQTKGVDIQMIHSNDIFANLNMNQLEQIEHAILEYWWVGSKEDNAKSLAEAQIAEALESIS